MVVLAIRWSAGGGAGTEKRRAVDDGFGLFALQDGAETQVLDVFSPRAGGVVEGGGQCRMCEVVRDGWVLEELVTENDSSKAATGRTRV